MALWCRLCCSNSNWKQCSFDSCSSIFSLSSTALHFTGSVCVTKLFSWICTTLSFAWQESNMTCAEINARVEQLHSKIEAVASIRDVCEFLTWYRIVELSTRQPGTQRILNEMVRGCKAALHTALNSDSASVRSFIQREHGFLIMPPELRQYALSFLSMRNLVSVYCADKSFHRVLFSAHSCFCFLLVWRGKKGNKKRRTTCGTVEDRCTLGGSLSSRMALQ